MVVAVVESGGVGRKRPGIIQRKYSGLAPGMAAAMRRVREQQHVSQGELARRLDCSQQYVSNVERDLVPLTAGWVMAVAKALGVPVKRIYDDRRNS